MVQNVSQQFTPEHLVLQALQQQHPGEAQSMITTESLNNLKLYCFSWTVWRTGNSRITAGTIRNTDGENVRE